MQIYSEKPYPDWEDDCSIRFQFFSVRYKNNNHERANPRNESDIAGARLANIVSVTVLLIFCCLFRRPHARFHPSESFTITSDGGGDGGGDGIAQQPSLIATVPRVTPSRSLISIGMTHARATKMRLFLVVVYSAAERFDRA